MLFEGVKQHFLVVKTDNILVFVKENGTKVMI